MQVLPLPGMGLVKEKHLGTKFTCPSLTIYTDAYIFFDGQVSFFTKMFDIHWEVENQNRENQNHLCPICL